MMNAKMFFTLLKREYWEHQSFIKTPIILASVIVVILLIGMLSTHDFMWSYSVSSSGIINRTFHGSIDIGNHTNIHHVISMMLYSSVVIPILIALCITIFFYVLSSLYDERRDRSILFWRSMPISDTATVLSKVFSALITAPVLAAIVALIAQIVVLILITIWGSIHIDNIWSFIWSFSLIKMFFNNFFLMILSALWLSPGLGWLWFVSSVAKKSPFLFAVFVPLGIMLVELLLLHSTHFAHLLAEWNHGLTALISHTSHQLSPFYIVSNVQFWIGLLIGSIFVAVATYIRRFNDDRY